jgi:hypothetical protein
MERCNSPGEAESQLGYHRHMGRLATLILLAATLPVTAQRVDGCSVSGQTTSIYPVMDEARDAELRGAGYSLSENSVESAVQDSNPSIRSLAALKLVARDQKSSIRVLMRAWSVEQDTCTKVRFENALGKLLRQHWMLKPETTERIVPFQPCTPTGQPVVSLRVEQLTPNRSRTYQGPTLRITARNLTTDTLPFLGDVDTAQLFSVTVLEPGGHPAKIPAEQSCFYQKCDPKSDPTRVLNAPRIAVRFSFRCRRKRT